MIWVYAIFVLGQRGGAARHNLEPPFAALFLGLILANTVGLPRWLDAGFRGGFYVETGFSDQSRWRQLPHAAL